MREAGEDQREKEKRAYQGRDIVMWVEKKRGKVPRTPTTTATRAREKERERQERGENV